MAPACIEFYFDFTCPYAYMASTRIEALARDTDATLFWRPMLLGGVFRSISDGHSPMEQMAPPKARHSAWDIHRYADHLDVPLSMPAAHPMRSVHALRALLSLPENEWPGVIHEMYRAYWVRGDDVTSEAVLSQVLEKAGIPQTRIQRAIEANQDPLVKDILRRRTDEAVARGVFGAPAILVHVDDTEEPYFFWGQDRLHMVRAVLEGWRPGRENTPVPETATNDLGDETGPTAAMRTRPPRRRVHFFYDFSSPFAYLASTQIERIAEQTGAELTWRPMLLGAVFREIGTPNVPIFAMPESKRRYILRDLDDWASYWNVPFRFASHFPQRTVTALRLALLAKERIGELSHALFRIPWVEDRDLEDDDILEHVLTDLGFPAQKMLARTRDPEVKEMLIANTTEAVERGVFGAPTCIVEEREGMTSTRSPLLFWGQDRLELVSAALSGWRPPHE